MQEENLLAGGKWETMSFLGIALSIFSHVPIFSDETEQVGYRFPTYVRM